MANEHRVARGKTSAKDYRHVGKRHLVRNSQLRRATGRSRREWFDALDEAGAFDWDHKRIVRWLGGKEDADAWWAQSVAIDYEHKRKAPVSPTVADPTTTAVITATVHSDVISLWPLLDDDDLRRAWLDCEFEVGAREGRLGINFLAADGSRIRISLKPLADMADGTPRSRVIVRHSHLPENAVEETRAFWKAMLGELVRMVA
ncbi:hypothetical protein EKN07_11290 [Actinobaculum sp. 352]|nr:hypothetical protein DDD63_00620 [Actinobaculum sp. 313]RTE48047.1 hypothetical protein EKN07_11290 [Actinobaculum sp. 352]